MAAPKLGEYITSINKTKHNMIRDPDADSEAVAKGYPAFMIRRMLSYHWDVVADANAMNLLPHLDNQMQYEFFLAQIPKQNRYALTHKVQLPENVELIKRYYKYSDEKALAVLALHTDGDIASIKAQMSEGGVIREE